MTFEELEKIQAEAGTKFTRTDFDILLRAIPAEIRSVIDAGTYYRLFEGIVSWHQMNHAYMGHWQELVHRLGDSPKTVAWNALCPTIRLKWSRLTWARELFVTVHRNALVNGKSHEQATAEAVHAVDTRITKQRHDEQMWRIREQLSRFDKWCPRRVHPRTLRLSELPNSHAFKAVVCDYIRQWADAELDEDTPVGIFAYGRTGKGKTRLLTLLARWHARNDYRVEAWTARGLKSRLGKLATTHSKGEPSVDDFIADVAEADVLLLDDLGHQTSDSFAENLRTILDLFTGRLFVSSNYDLKALVGRFETTVLGEAVVRRVCEMCSPVNFDKFPSSVSDTMSPTPLAPGARSQ